jgi:C1A family cysteine protease
MRATSIKIKDSAPHRLGNGRHGGWLPDRPNSLQSRPLSKRLDLGVVTPQNPFLPPESYPEMRDQGSQGSCTGHGTCNALEQRLLSRDAAFWRKYRLSPASAYLNGRKIDGTVKHDYGSYIHSVVRGASEWGVARLDHAPYDPRRLTTSLSKQAIESAKWHQAINAYRCDNNGVYPNETVDNILKALAAGMPVVFGFTCFTNLSQADADGLIRLPGSSDREDGGHCMCIYEGDTSTREFIGPNSWGPWGHRGRDGQMGYFRLPFDYFLRGLADDAQAIDHE